MTKVAINPTAGHSNTSPLSPGLVAGPFLFISGQIGTDLTTGALAEGGVEGQTEQVLKKHV
jgi:enamine deaminase RidA (YjgF/YER057c/UK114 family)